MKRFLSSIVMIFFLVSTFSGCATSETNNKTAFGAAIGGVGGAIYGFAKTGKLKDAAIMAGIGAAAGALLGFAIGKYEENQVKTRKQVYREYPEYSKRSTAPDPAIKDLNADLLDTRNQPIESFSGGQTIKMASEYTIVASPEVKNVQVEENNYLVMPDGTRTPDAKRTKSRGVQRVVAKQTVTLPKELLPGKYTHMAIVKIGDKTEQSEQTIEVAAMKTDMRQYAFKGIIK
ncbi:MAG: hypothetical protein AB1480_08135 [Nitrospirota bacterium]